MAKVTDNEIGCSFLSFNALQPPRKNLIHFGPAAQGALVQLLQYDLNREMPTALHVELHHLPSVSAQAPSSHYR